MLCPRCGAEQESGVAECPGCGAPLGDAAHPEPDLVELTEIAEPALLPVIVGLLESAGIEPVVEGDDVMGVLPVGQFGAGGWSGKGRGLSVVLKVPRERAEEAAALLAEAVELDDGEPE